MTAPRMFAFAAALALSAAIAAAPHAALALGSTPVTVTNPSLPVTVGNPDDPAAFAKAQGIQHPFDATIRCEPASNSGVDIYSCGGQLDLSAFNPNQRLIIEYASLFCQMDPGEALSSVRIITVNGGQTIDHWVTITDHLGALDSGNRPEVDIGQTVRLYADANSTVTVAAGVSFTDTAANPRAINCAFSITGQAIDVP